MADEFVTMKVDGFEEVRQALSTLPNDLAKKALREITAAGARVVLKEARQLAPRDKGGLAKSIKMRTKWMPRKGMILIKITPTGEYAHLGHLIEFGTKAHWIESRWGKKLGYKGKFGKRVFHPGTPAQPFLRPAFDSKINEVMTLMRKQTRKAVQRQAKVVYARNRNRRRNRRRL